MSRQESSVDKDGEGNTFTNTSAESIADVQSINIAMTDSKLEHEDPDNESKQVSSCLDPTVTESLDSIEQKNAAEFENVQTDTIISNAIADSKHAEDNEEMHNISAEKNLEVTDNTQANDESTSPKIGEPDELDEPDEDLLLRWDDEDSNNSLNTKVDESLRTGANNVVMIIDEVDQEESCCVKNIQKPLESNIDKSFGVNVKQEPNEINKDEGICQNIENVPDDKLENHSEIDNRALLKDADKHDNLSMVGTDIKSMDICDVLNSDSDVAAVNEDDKDSESIAIHTKIVDKIEPTAITNKSNLNMDADIPFNEAVTKTAVEFPENVLKIECMNMSLDKSVPAFTSHGINQPDVMLEIPTQELIDIDDTAEFSLVDGDDDDCQKSLENYSTFDVAGINILLSTNVTEKEDENSATDNLQIEVNEHSVSIQKGIEKNSDNISHNSSPKMHNADDANILEEQVKICDNVIKLDGIEESVKMQAKEVANEKLQKEQPSTSGVIQPTESSITRMVPETDDECPEVIDSLGLLAESSRMIEDDEEQEDDEDAEGDCDDDEDFYQEDESSNQMTAENSEDSSTPQTEAEVCKDTPDPSTGQNESSAFTFKISIPGGEVLTEGDGPKATSPTPEAMEITESVKENELPVKEQVIQLEDRTKDAELQSTNINTVKHTDLSETGDNESGILSKESDTQDDSPKQDSPSKQSPSKTKKLEISQQKHVVSIVDLEESSSEDDAEDRQETEPDVEPQRDEVPTEIDIDGVTSVNIPSDIEVMSSGENTSEIRAKPGEVVISGVPKPPPHKPARLNTSEVTIKTVSNTESTLVIPETKLSEAETTKPKLSLEIFSLDSDEDDGSAKTIEEPAKGEEDQARSKCVNSQCVGVGPAQYELADRACLAHYHALRRRRALVCRACALPVQLRAQNLINGIKALTPLLDLAMEQESEDLVEISDSESEDEADVHDEPKETIGAEGAKLLEENLANIINETWEKYNMDTRLKDTQDILDSEIHKLEMESEEIDMMLAECQVATDKLRSDLYSTFRCRRKQLTGLIICDTPYAEYSVVEEAAPVAESEVRQPKRRLSSGDDMPAKRPPIPLGYAPLDDSNAAQNVDECKSSGPDIDISPKDDDDKDISVVKLSAEAAPPDLPPRAAGEPPRAPLRPGMEVYAMKYAFGAWLRAKVVECQPKVANMEWTMCGVTFVDKVKIPTKVIAGRCLAYSQPSEYRMTIGTRVIALFKDAAIANKRNSFYSGIIAEIPNPVNNYRYLVFFDVGSAQYIRHADTRLVCESSTVVWQDMHPFSRGFVRDYLTAYPERPMVRLHAGQKLRTEWNGQWWSSRVVQVDASLVEVHFAGDGRREWIYRGSTRLEPLYNELQVAQRHKHRALPRSKAQPRSNLPSPYVEYTRTDEQGSSKVQTTQEQPPPVATPQQQRHTEELRRQRAVAKKSTSASPAAPPTVSTGSNLDSVTSRVVYYTPKNAVKPYKMTAHTCGPKCKRSDVLALKDLRTYNPLAKPLLSGWERQLVRYKGHKEVMYRAPCGRRVRSMAELHRYLRAARCDMPVDLFDFHPATHCLAEFVLNKCIVWKRDLSHGKENVPVPCVNYYDESLPEFCSYNTERTPTAGVPLNLDPEFLCGCDCNDDCEDKSKCACWKLTLEGARTIGLEGDVGYTYRRLPDPLPSGIYECNSRCKCKNTCLNRVVQHPLQLKLQVFKTLNRGWGIRALNDVPKGSFLCVYAGNLLTDATANLDGLNEGDEYLAELDYIEVVEQMKEGYEDDIPEADKALDKKEIIKTEEQSEESSQSEDEEQLDKNDQEDTDFQPGYIDSGPTQFNKRLRRRGKEAKDSNPKSKEKDGDCITISDDEEVREPMRFTAQAGMGTNAFVPKYKSVRSHYGEDEACYIIDAKVQGNIGRYLNHSCCPNVFVQNVFVDTHDPRFPWVSFFALSHIRAGTELTWNYNYDIGSVPGKVLYCYCGAPNCRGRLL